MKKKKQKTLNQNFLQYAHIHERFCDLPCNVLRGVSFPNKNEKFLDDHLLQDKLNLFK